MSNIKNLGDLSINIPKNLEKVENVIIENDVFEIENKNLDKNLLLKSIRENEEAREKAEWVDMDNMIIENLVNQFTTYSDDNDIEWNKFDYNTYDYEYYKNKFPLFDDNVIDILVKCSKKKAEDNRIKPLEKKEGNFIVEFD